MYVIVEDGERCVALKTERKYIRGFIEDFAAWFLARVGEGGGYSPKPLRDAATVAAAMICYDYLTQLGSRVLPTLRPADTSKEEAMRGDAALLKLGKTWTLEIYEEGRKVLAAEVKPARELERSAALDRLKRIVEIFREN